MMDSTYAAVLSWTFIVSNGARLLAYLPTIAKLARPGCTGEGHSELTWLLWTVSIATLTLQMFEQLQRQVDPTVLLSLGNVLMNLVVLSMVRKSHRRACAPHLATASRATIQAMSSNGVVPCRT